MPELTRLEVTVEQEKSDLLNGVLTINAIYGWEEENLPTGELRCRIHSDNPVFCQELTQEVHGVIPEACIEVSKVQDVDWVSAWKDFFTPVRAGSHFIVLAPWMEKEKTDALASGIIPIIIEPKTAFGTGHHATTALCLKAISDFADKGRIKEGMKFLDLGTGSGILGIACCLLGLTGLGLDIDILAVENAVENRAINGIPEAAFQVERAGLDYVPEELEGSYDLVLSNILAEPLRMMAPRLSRMPKKNGMLALSGILGIQAEGVGNAYKNSGLSEPNCVIDGEWAALVWGNI